MLENVDEPCNTQDLYKKDTETTSEEHKSWKENEHPQIEEEKESFTLPQMNMPESTFNWTKDERQRYNRNTT